MNSSSMLPAQLKAVVLAGGLGTRLLPYTTVLPKPLLPVGDRPVLEVVLNWLRESGVRNLVISVGHLAELITAFFQDGSKWGLNIEYAVEDKPLGTIGPLAFIENLGDHFLVVNGDTITDLSLPKMYEYHVTSEAALTVATASRQVKIDFGVVNYDDNSRQVEGFEEKPRLLYDVSMGIYFLTKRCLDFISQGEVFGFDQLLLALLQAGERVQAFPHQGQWLDIGRMEDYELAQQLFGQQRQSGPASDS